LLAAFANVLNRVDANRDKGQEGKQEEKTKKDGLGERRIDHPDKQGNDGDINEEDGKRCYEQQDACETGRLSFQGTEITPIP
jgi:hypothetical protein